MAQENEKQIASKLYKCQKCGKEVVADDFNFYYKICYTCEHKSGNIGE